MHDEAGREGSWIGHAVMFVARGARVFYGFGWIHGARKGLHVNHRQKMP